MKLVWLVCLLLAASPLASAQKREYQELQRDIASLQDQVRTLQRAVDEKMAELKVLVQQAVDSGGKTNTSVAVLDSALRERLKEQEKLVVAPVAGIGAKVDQMASEFAFLRSSIEDLNSRMGKLEQRIVDLGNAVKVMQSPAPPPSTSSVTGAPDAPPPAGVSAAALYANAMRDKDAGNYDLALQQFTDYLRYFGGTDTAPNAQFYVGEISYNRKDYPAALKAFDMVLEKYPENNNKRLDALFMKGRSLVQLRERDNGAECFRQVIKISPNSELANKAAAQLRALGLPANASPRRVVKGKKR